MDVSAGPVYRAIQPDEIGAVASMMTMSFGNPQEAESYVERNNYPEQFRVLDDGGELVAGAWFGRLGQWWLGRRLPSAQVLNVGVPPQHRGRGHATALMRALLHELHDDGIPTATLFASSATLYRGVGFECAGQWFWYQVLAEHLPRSTAGYQAREISIDDLAEARALYDRVAPTRHGALDRDDNWWRDRIGGQRGGSRPNAAFILDGPIPPEARALVPAGDGSPSSGPVGWAVLTFGRYDEWKTEVTVRDWGCLPGAEPALYGLLGGFGVLEGRVQWSGPYPDPMLLALPERRYRLDEADEWFLRIVNLPDALTRRPWPAGLTGRLTFRVDDPICPWNTGDWSLELADGKAMVERAPAGATTLTISIRGLASLFTGFLGPLDLARASLISGLDEPATALLQQAFASPTPWTAEHY